MRRPRIKRSKPLNADQKIALEALQKCHHRYRQRPRSVALNGRMHTAENCPIKTQKGAEMTGRHLIKKGLVGADKWTVWLLTKTKS